MRQLAEMATSSPPFDALIVEASGISEPQQVAEAFDLPIEDADNGEVCTIGDGEKEETVEEKEEKKHAADVAAASAALRAAARLDCCVSVVDALQFPRDALASRDSLKDRGQQAGPDDVRAVASLLIEQVEFADVLILNKCDMVSVAERETLLSLMRTLNPRAKLIPAERSAVDPSTLLKCNAFDMSVARSTSGWLQSLSGTALPESEEYGISHVVFRARRPFHPRRLYNLLFEGSVDVSVHP